MDSSRSVASTRTKTTLRKLNIYGPTGLDTSMGSLQVFEALRVIRTEWELLFPKYNCLETWPSRVLPASLLKLELRDKSDRSLKEYRALFQGLQRAKERTCLHLISVDIGSPWDKVHKGAEIGHLSRFCKGLGISLKFEDFPTSVPEVPTSILGMRTMSLTFDTEV